MRLKDGQYLKARQRVWPGLLRELITLGGGSKITTARFLLTNPWGRISGWLSFHRSLSGFAGARCFGSSAASWASERD